ncbi:MAG: T9SS type A sorting domain-containing protein [Bacteroidota bacterium]
MFRSLWLFTLLFPAVISVPAQAQLVLTAADFQAQTSASFQEFLADNNNGNLPNNLAFLPDLLLLDGNNNTFDFAAITAQLPLFSTNYYLSFPSDSVAIPGAASTFNGEVTDVWQVDFEESSTPDIFIFRSITADSLAWLGNGVWQDTNADGTPDPVVSVFSPGKLQAPLPLQMGNAWQSDFTHINTVETPIGVVEIPGVVEEHDIQVDGYGTLITHNGSFPCLRIRINQTILSPDGSSQELGGWSFVTADLEQLGVFYDQHIPADPAEISFDLSSPQSISLFSPSNTMTTAIAPTTTAGSDRLMAHPNYPNPFLRETTLPFELTEAGHVRLSIFNSIGQRVALLVDETRAAGKHAVRWTPENMPSGLYFFELETDGAISRRTMLHVK